MNQEALLRGTEPGDKTLPILPAWLVSDPDTRKRILHGLLLNCAHLELVSRLAFIYFQSILALGEYIFYLG